MTDNLLFSTRYRSYLVRYTDKYIHSRRRKQISSCYRIYEYSIECILQNTSTKLYHRTILQNDSILIFYSMVLQMSSTERALRSIFCRTHLQNTFCRMVLQNHLQNTFCRMVLQNGSVESTYSYRTVLHRKSVEGFCRFGNW